MSDLTIFLAIGWGVWIILWAWAVVALHRSQERELALWCRINRDGRRD